MADKEKKGLTGTEKAIVGATLAENAIRYKKQSAWLLRNAWKWGSRLAKRNPYTFAILTAMSTLSTDYAQEKVHEAWSAIERSVGKEYKNVHAWIDDVMKDPNIANASADVLNRNLPQGVFTGLPADVLAAIPDKLKDVHAARRGALDGVVSDLRRHEPATDSVTEANCRLLGVIRTYFGARNSQAVYDLHTALLKFIQLDAAAVREAAAINDLR
jgi:hypothetical protein